MEKNQSEIIKKKEAKETIYDIAKEIAVIIDKIDNNKVLKK